MVGRLEGRKEEAEEVGRGKVNDEPQDDSAARQAQEFPTNFNFSRWTFTALFTNPIPPPHHPHHNDVSVSQSFGNSLLLVYVRPLIGLLTWL